MLYNANGGTLTIANGGTTSNSIEIGHANAVTIYAPAALTGSVRAQVSRDNAVWRDISLFGGDLLIPANKATSISGIGSKYLRLVSDSAEGAARAFETTLQEQGTRA